MRTLVLLLSLCSMLGLANDKKLPSKIKEVTVYLNGAQITRNAVCNLKPGTTQVALTGLSNKIDESSIQISGLQAVSILSMSYDINYLEKPESTPEFKALEDKIQVNSDKIARLKNLIHGLEEEEKVITGNRLVSSETQTVDLEIIKQLSAYYRERITAIKNEVFTTNREINNLNMDNAAFRKQLAELNNSPQQEQGEITLKFDAPIATNLNLVVSYMVDDAGWIPNYDIKSKKLNDPLSLKYNAHVYQKTGEDWNNVSITLSTGNPNVNVAKPNMEAKYLNFVSSSYRSPTATKKDKFYYNPTIKRILGKVTEASGSPLPGCNVMVKGTSNGTQTDFEGNYSLDIVEGQELVFSYVGFKTEEQPIYSSIMNVRLDEDASQLEEVVVTGYSSGISRGLAGSAPGVHIRGASSINKQQTPLFIIDGIVADGYVEGDLSPYEIQSTEVLKGEAATSIYGSRANNGVIVITTKKSTVDEGVTNAKFKIKKPYSIVSDADITVIEINTFQLEAEYEYFAAPVLNKNVFLTAMMKDWEQHQLLPGEANIYFEGAYAGKTTINPYATTKELTISLGIDPNVVVTRKQPRNFKSRSFTGSNRILDRVYVLEVKNNKSTPVSLKLMDRIPISQNKEIKVDEIETNTADYDRKKGILSWKMDLASKAAQQESFSYQLKYPRFKRVNL